MLCVLVAGAEGDQKNLSVIVALTAFKQRCSSKDPVTTQNSATPQAAKAAVHMPSKTAWLAITLITAVVLASAGVFIFRDYIWGIRADARAAVQSLNDSDLDQVEVQLAQYRGNEAFAYYFADMTTPQALGDALSSVAGSDATAPLSEEITPHEYEILLTDLAGVLALATHGRGDRSLDASWTQDFITATTTPALLYGTHQGFFDSEGKQRERQDVANRANLLLLLSRGYWSTEFLQEVTKHYYEFDRELTTDAWPSAKPGGTAAYAPAPNGAFLTDGIAALTAALTANPSASEWAFTEFLPGTQPVEGTQYSVGNFTHFLMFEHQFTKSTDDESIGMTATLTALSSAALSTNPSLDPGFTEETTPLGATVEHELAKTLAEANPGPLRDVATLQTIVHEAQAQGCSWAIIAWGKCIVEAAQVVWSWIRQWGHTVLDFLAFATVAPFPLMLIGVAAATANAAWYALEEDFASAGLSLASAVPGLVLGKLAGVAKITAKAENIQVQTVSVAKASRYWWPQKAYRNCDLARANGGITVSYKNFNRAQRSEANRKIKAINQAARRGEVVKTSNTNRADTGKIWKDAHQKPPPEGKDLDHTVDLQLGGSNDISNLRPLDPRVNRSLGIQITHQLKSFSEGATIPAIAICK